MDDPTPPLAATSTVSCACTLADAREATRALHGFLSRHGLTEDELFACELALVEACNNAVQYVDPARRLKPLVLAVTCTPTRVEMQVHDQTPGFDLPEKTEQPEPGIERGRGLFLIRSMVDEVTYQRGADSNTIRMVKRRSAP